MSNLFYLFSDESCCDSNNRYSSIAVVSGSKTDSFELNKSLLEILGNKKEFKFKSTRSDFKYLR